jgi:YggT family protein
MSILIGAIFGLLHLVITIYILVIIISAFLSFIPIDPRNPFVEIITRVTYPIFQETRRRVPWVVVSGFDLSPILIIFVLHFIDTMIMGASMSIAFMEIFRSIITMFTWIVIIAAILSFVSIDPRNPIIQALNRMTRPLFDFVRIKMPFVVVSGVDLSPIVIIIALQLIDNILLQIMMRS